MKPKWQLIACICLLLIACNNEREQWLCKRWQVSEVLFLNEDASLVQSDTMQGNLQERTKAILRDVMMKNVYEFKSDGSYITANAAATAEGQWEFSGQNIRFISEHSEGQKEKIVPIEKLQDDTLIVLYQKDQTTLQMKLILTPIN
jgi:hypothetical protein